jgi:hypothetical protein
MKFISSYKILDHCLFDQEEFFSNMLCHQWKLLFDCINEVLMEVCEHYFGISPWVKGNSQGWEGVCWLVLPLPPPHTSKLFGKIFKDMEYGWTFDLMLKQLVLKLVTSFLQNLWKMHIESCESKYVKLMFFASI